MKNINIRVFTILSVAIVVGTFSFATAQTSTDVKTNSKVEISLPVEKDDFLLFYGVTNDTQVNAELSDLRKDFVEKFNNLKDEYKKSFNTIVNNSELKPGVPEEKSGEVKPVTAQATLKASVNSKAMVDSKALKESATSVTNTIKKYVIEDTKNVVITPIVNIVNDKAAVKTEASSWFQKIKSWFGW